MINSFYKAFNITSPVAGIIISIALMLITGFAMTRITKRLRLLNGTLKVKSEKAAAAAERHGVHTVGRSARPVCAPPRAGEYS